jgi:hypothetical protein
MDKAPKELKGRTLRVTFYVLADGRVSRVETDPDIQDKDYARNVRERFGSFRFRPARNPEGLPVPGVSVMNFTLPSK